MQMSFVAPGPSTSAAEVTNVSRHGFWLLLGQEELFVPFSDFPWFETASIGALMNVEWPSPDHLYWPDLDVDLAVSSIHHQEQFPLISKASD
jgi:hypothetical protein